MQQLSFALFNGIASGMVIFLVAAGVTLIFGILKIINFSHGAFFMLGAYIAFALVGDSMGSVWMLLGTALVAGAGVGICGYFVDKIILSRIRDFDEHYVLIATFAVLLMVTGGIKLIWGLDYYFVAPPTELAGALFLGPVILPTYSLFVIAVGVVSFIGLEIVLHRMWIGKVLRSVVSDSWMVGLLGYNVAALYTGTVMFAFFMAGAAGALLVPNQSLSPTLADSYLLLGFVCCIIGGLGNVRGAFIAALFLGIVESLSSLYLNAVPGLTVYIAMVLALLFRPQGIFGSAETGQQAPGNAIFSLKGLKGRAGKIKPRAGVLGQSAGGEAAASGPALRSLTEGRRYIILPAIGLALAGVCLSMPLWANPGLLFLVGITMIEALFALSWNFLFTYAGVVSFGHAAFFALGAYGTGLMLKYVTGLPFLLSLLAVSFAGGFLALVVGSIALKRTTGIYLAILTMALAEIFHLIIGYSDIVGRDDGLPAIPRPSVFGISLSSGTAYFYFIAISVIVVGGLLWWLAHSRFGRMLRSIHQDPERASFMGLAIAGYRLKAFVISASVAAFAGGLFAPWTQIVTPETTALLHSVSPVLNTLLGGASSFFGPVVGAFAFALLDFGTRTFAGVSEVMIGAILLLVVLAAPDGIVGFLKKLERLVMKGLGRNPGSAASARTSEQ